MALFVVSYDLHRNRNYERITSVLKENGAERILESLWLLQVQNKAEGLLDKLKVFIDGDDSLVVIELKAGSDWASLRAQPRGIAWLKKHIHP